MSSDVVYGIDIGTTSVSGVAVDGSGRVAASVTVPHHADLSTNGNGVDEQDPDQLLAATLTVLSSLLKAPIPQDVSTLPIGWTGQMHGVVAVDGAFNPLTPFVTWRDARRYGGEVMRIWGQTPAGGIAQGGASLQRIDKCLTAPGYVIAKLTGRCVIDPTFLESWHVAPGTVPEAWLPDLDESSMLGDNQAGVYAAQTLYPGAAVVNIGTSGQLSVVSEDTCSIGSGDSPLWDFSKVEKRCFPGGKTLVCRASLVGGQRLAALQRRLGISWDELNEKGLRALKNLDARGTDPLKSRGTAPLKSRGTDPLDAGGTGSVAAEILACVDEVVGDLFVGMDLTGVKTLVGVGNALVRNPVLREALERRSGLKCVCPDIPEMAAYGAAVFGS